MAWVIVDAAGFVDDFGNAREGPKLSGKTMGLRTFQKGLFHLAQVGFF
jgi:hypothetical protein